MKRKLDFDLPKGQATESEILVYIMEEASEVAHAASKCLRFGMHKKRRGCNTPYENLIDEFHDLSEQFDRLYLVFMSNQKDEFGNTKRDQSKYPLAAHGDHS